MAQEARDSLMPIQDRLEALRSGGIFFLTVCLQQCWNVALFGHEYASIGH
jgi:hypothetical protein